MRQSCIADNPIWKRKNKFVNDLSIKKSRDLSEDLGEPVTHQFRGQKVKPWVKSNSQKKNIRRDFEKSVIHQFTGQKVNTEKVLESPIE